MICGMNHRAAIRPKTQCWQQAGAPARSAPTKIISEDGQPTSKSATAFLNSSDEDLLFQADRHEVGAAGIRARPSVDSLRQSRRGSPGMAYN
jgi:hypothetical protein